jgi:hypothetical protein
MWRLPASDELIVDLFSSLGSLGFTAFQMMKTQKSKLGAHAANAATAMVLLENVAATLDLGKTSWQFELGEDGEFSIGRDIDGTKANVKKLETIVGSKDQAVAWYGYESEAGKPFLSIWFYCSQQKGAADVKARIPPGSVVSGSKASDEPHFVNIRLDAKDSTGDQEWFLEHLKPFFP